MLNGVFKKDIAYLYGNPNRDPAELSACGDICATNVSHMVSHNATHIVRLSRSRPDAYTAPYAQTPRRSSIGRARTSTMRAPHGRVRPHLTHGSVQSPSLMPSPAARVRAVGLKLSRATPSLVDLMGSPTLRNLDRQTLPALSFRESFPPSQTQEPCLHTHAQTAVLISLHAPTKNGAPAASLVALLAWRADHSCRVCALSLSPYGAHSPCSER